MSRIFTTFAHKQYETMRKIIKITALVLAAMTVAGCSEKKKSDTIITKKVVAEKPSAPISMQEYDQDRDVEWNGKMVSSRIHRAPDSSLPMVKDETGQPFVDNSITLTITRDDASVAFKKVFTKSTFDQYLDGDYRKTGILEGLVFDKIEGNRLRYAASVSLPQTDEYIPLVVLIAPDGSMTIERDTQLDTSAEE